MTAISTAADPLARHPEWEAARDAPLAGGAEPLVGHGRAMLTDPFTLLLRGREAHGDVVQFRLGPERLVLVSDLASIDRVLRTDRARYSKRTRPYEKLAAVFGAGLVTNDGESWLRQRRIAQPAFHRARVQGFADVMRIASEDMAAAWAGPAGRGEPVDVAAEMGRLTLRIVAQTLFGADVDRHTDTIGQVLVVLQDEIMRRMNSPFDFPEKLPLPRTRAFERARTELENIVEGIIADRRAHPGDRGALLDLLMAARDADTGEGMSPRQLRDEALTVFLAGHDTTAAALTWTFLLLSRHPEWDRRLAAELQATLGDGPATPASIAPLTLVGRVLDESMRLFPPVPILSRCAEADDVLAGVRVPRGSIVTISPYTVHRDPRHWPNPEGFDPDRFLPGAVEARPKNAFIPFSAGPRVCIGAGFAMQEATIVLATLLRKWRLALVPGHPVGWKAVISLQPTHGIRMTLHPRTEAS